VSSAPDPPAAVPELERRLREAGSAELAALVAEHAAELAAPMALQALRNPFCTAEVIALVAAERRLTSFHQLRRALAFHPLTPETLAAGIVPTLFWRDLMELALDPRVRPALRRAAELQLTVRLPGLAVGEKVSLARRAGGGVLAQLCHDPSPRVVAALLDNSRLTEGLLAPVVHRAATPAAILELIAADRRWGVRYPLRVALARNPATPLATAWRLLAALRKSDLQAVAADLRLPEPLRRRARVLLEETG
jgi:hypothetical protein